MNHPIFKKQEERKDEIQAIFDKYQGTKAWSQATNAFGEIMKKFVHGGQLGMDHETVEQHFKNAILFTKKDIQGYRDLMEKLHSGDREANSPYYMLNVAHNRHDKFFAVNQPQPIRGTGHETLNAKFHALNLYEKYEIKSTSSMPTRIVNQEGYPFQTWDDIVQAMTDRTTFDNLFGLTDKNQADEVFATTSSVNWQMAQGNVIITPTLAFGQVFSPALYSVYFIGATPTSPKNIYFFVTADAFGNPTAPFVGLVNDSTPTVYASTNRAAFTPLSYEGNPAKYWMEVDEGNADNFTLNTQTFFTDHPNSPYIEVNAHFNSQVPATEATLFRYTPGVDTFLMLGKATLMRDLVKAYYPDKSSLQLWEEIGAITTHSHLLAELEALGLDLVADFFDLFVWDEKPTVTP